MLYFDDIHLRNAHTLWSDDIRVQPFHNYVRYAIQTHCPVLRKRPALEFGAIIFIRMLEFKGSKTSNKRKLFIIASEFIGKGADFKGASCLAGYQYDNIKLNFDWTICEQFLYAPGVYKSSQSIISVFELFENNF